VLFYHAMRGGSAAGVAALGRALAADRMTIVKPVLLFGEDVVSSHLGRLALGLNPYRFVKVLPTNKRPTVQA
jgi:hypothetical protein